MTLHLFPYLLDFSFNEKSYDFWNFLKSKTSNHFFNEALYLEIMLLMFIRANESLDQKDYEI